MTFFSWRAPTEPSIRIPSATWCDMKGLPSILLRVFCVGAGDGPGRFFRILMTAASSSDMPRFEVASVGGGAAAAQRCV